MNRWLYPLLVAVPGAAVLWALNRDGSAAGQYTLWVFILALVGLVPLAAIIGGVTDRLTDYLGPKISGFISASFSNVPELAIGGFFLWHAGQAFASGGAEALKEGGAGFNDFAIVRGLLIGSIINNILLVLGVSVFFGGLRHGKLKFDKDQAAGFASMLALAVVGLALPTLATGFATAEAKETGETTTTIVVSAILIFIYVVYVGADIFGFGEKPRKAVAEREAVAVAAGEAHGHEGHEGGEHHHGGHHVEAETEEERDRRKRDEADEAAHAIRLQRRQQQPYAIPLLISVLAVATILTVGLAGVLVDVTDHVITGTFLTPFSTGFILFPIVCNFGELAAAFGSAWRGKIEEGMEVASGSSVQVPLFVTPALVFISLILAFGNPNLLLVLQFSPLELIVVGLATFVYALVNLDGETTWLEGLQLIAFFSMIAVTAFVLPGA